jgi:NADP-dependent alcohol dehydrogenase
MHNFTAFNPTRILFGRGTIPVLDEQIPASAKVMLVYGGGSIRRNGVYEAVKTALGTREILEFGGIEPNPDFATCSRAVELARAEKVDFLLSVGGGSVLDGVKFIAAAVPFEGDPWDILAAGAPIAAALPVGCVLTLPATGSEANPGSVISRRETGDKLFFMSEHTFPRFSILDPETTFSLPPEQTANGIADAFVHCGEQYLTYSVNTPLQDRQAEAVMLTLIEEAPKVLANPQDYDARANIMWAATNALNGVLSLGVVADWASHMIGHELTAAFGLDHGRTLTIVLPSLLRRQKAGKHEKLLQFARRVWGIQTPDSDAAIEEGICAMEDFFGSLGLPVRLQECGIEATATKPIVEKFARQGFKLGERQDIDATRIGAILDGAA